MTEISFLMRILIIIISLFFVTSLSAQEQRGKASYYSKKATGSRTSSGEKLHHDSMTCAHRTYPFGTILKVSCPATGRTVNVRVTDRGPFGHGRIIDLSWGAARELGILNMGVATVQVEVIKKGGPLGPVKPDDNLELPEIDFVVSNAGYEFLPEMQKYSLDKQELPASKSQIPKRKAEPKTNKKLHPNSTNIWSDIFHRHKKQQKVQ
ncbi:MAG: septal ring lytic transglycosylase RlpA family protein [Prevotella sp.]|nr:septal ring lytic transglycosylase RlpA family protein [Prevotella sp.]